MDDLVCTIPDEQTGLFTPFLPLNEKLSKTVRLCCRTSSDDEVVVTNTILGKA